MCQKMAQAADPGRTGLVFKIIKKLWCTVVQLSAVYFFLYKVYARIWFFKILKKHIVLRYRILKS